LANYRDVKELEYPSKVTLGEVLKGLWQTSKLDVLFHGLMTLLLVTGLAIDLLGVFLGGLLFPIRRIAHGYIGVLFVVIYPIYLGKLLATRKTRMLMTATNYIDFVLYAILLLTGIAIASVNQPWVDLLPWLPSALGVLRLNAPAIHTVTTYGWLLISVLLPGGFLHGIATSYVIYLRGRR
jgi:hypothetical protein